MVAYRDSKVKNRHWDAASSADVFPSKCRANFKLTFEIFPKRENVN